MWRNEAVLPAVGDVIQFSCCCSGVRQWRGRESRRGREKRGEEADGRCSHWIVLDYMTVITNKKKHKGGEHSVGASGGHVCS